MPPGLCAGLGFAESPAFGGNKLASLPPDLGELARLEELWLSDNEIVSLPASVAKLVRLRRLRLARNRLRFDRDETSPPDDENTSLRFLGSCAAARELALDGNPGIARVPSSFGALANLETLSLDDTRVAVVPAEVFEGCVALTRLSLRNTPAARNARRCARARLVTFSTRRARSRDKQIAGNVLVSGMDDIAGTNVSRKR